MESISRVAAFAGIAAVVLVFWWLLPDTHLTAKPSQHLAADFTARSGRGHDDRHDGDGRF